MKKRNVLVVMMILVSISLVSAEYECSDGSLLLSDQDEIQIGDKESINGFGIGLISSDETPVFGTYSAELIIDAGKFLLSDQDNSTDINLKKGAYTITLLNSTESDAKIDVGGSSNTLNEGETGTINNLIIYLSNVEGAYPGTASVEGIIGVEKVSLSNEASVKIVTVSETDYLLELFSASDTNAIVKVKKCDNESADIIEISDSEDSSSIEITELNQTEDNETVEKDNQTLETEENVSRITEETSNVSEDLETDVTMEKEFSYLSVFFIGVIVVIIIIVLVYIKMRGSDYPKGEEVIDVERYR